MRELIFSVAQINDYVKGIFSRDPILRNIYIRGEISNFKFHTSGHMYFSLKDEDALVRCVMFRQHNMNLTFLPQNGMSVIIKGYISLYTKDGQYQCYAEEMQNDGLGSLFITFEAMKQKLLMEGLFDEQFKKKLPYLPRKIGVVTSHTGAAIRDIIQIAARRYRNMDILVVPVRVQGQQAAKEIAEALDYLNTRSDIDLIIVGRGGGSIEELWAFNEECVARSIFRSRIPVVSAVGHETDFTIADFVADSRAPTPSAAAELCVPMKDDLMYSVLQLKQRMMLSFERLLTLRKQQLKQLQESPALRKPQRRLDQQRQTLDQRMKYLDIYMQRILDKKREAFRGQVEKLNSLSPLAVLGRGYAVLENIEKRNFVKSIHELQKGQEVLIRLQDGKAKAHIQAVYDKKDNLEDESLG